MLSHIKRYHGPKAMILQKLQLCRQKRLASQTMTCEISSSNNPSKRKDNESLSDDLVSFDPDEGPSISLRDDKTETEDSFNEKIRVYETTNGTLGSPTWIWFDKENSDTGALKVDSRSRGMFSETTLTVLNPIQLSTLCLFANYVHVCFHSRIFNKAN
jgi:Mg2+ and Co2+ transporter CorA